MTKQIAARIRNAEKNIQSASRQVADPKNAQIADRLYQDIRDWTAEQMALFDLVQGE